MTVKDFKAMINRVRFCTESRFAEETSRNAELYLKKTDGNLIIAASGSDLYYQFGFARQYVGDNFPDFYGASLKDAHDMKKVANMKGSGLLSISSHAHMAWSDYLSMNIVAYTELHFKSGSACVSAKEYSSDLDLDWINTYDSAERFTQFFPRSFSVDRLMLLEAIGMVASIANPQFSCLMYLDLSPGVLTLRTFDFEDSATVDIPCDYSGEETTLTFEVKLLAETIKHIDTEQISIRFDGQEVNAAILPVHADKGIAEKQDYFFILGQKIRRGDNHGIIWRET